MRNKRILVLGATGHLGAKTAIFLHQKGYDIVAVGHRKSDNGFFSKHSIPYIGGFSIEDRTTYVNLPTDIDAVVHLAGTMPAHANADPMPYIQSIVVGMVNLCEWLKEIGCKRIIYNTTPSDISHFFGTSKPVKDDMPRSFPKDGGDHAVYAIAKNAAVDILEHYKYSDGFSSCVFRHLTVYGYHPNPYYYLNGRKKILPWRYILNQALKGEIIEVWGNPENKKELLYIKDFALAVKCALETNAEGIFNLAGTKPYTLEEQIDGLIQVFSLKDQPSKKVYEPKKKSTPQNLLDSNKAHNILRWQPKYDWISACEDMLKEMKEEPFALLWGKKGDY